jgi:hypothetical protein
MNFKVLVTPGTIASLCTILGLLAIAFKAPGLADFLNDPNTQKEVMVVFATVGSLISGALKGLHPDAVKMLFRKA